MREACQTPNAEFVRWRIGLPAKDGVIALVAYDELERVRITLDFLGRLPISV